jgi:phosphoglycerol transferase MdoB-like AlkP superfamily enzyme
MVLHLMPFGFFYTKSYQLLLKFLYFIPGIFMLLLNCIDCGLFRFAGKRITADVMNIMSYGDDFKNTVPVMIADFWYLFLIFLFLSFILVKVYKRISLTNPGGVQASKRTAGPLISLMLHLFFLALIFIGFRGGIQYKPINILSAAKYGKGQYASLVLNSPFTFLKTVGKPSLREVNFFSKEELDKIYPTLITPADTGSFRELNVVLIIMESIGNEYIGKFNNGKGYTPFLDSLMDHSLVFRHAFANCKRSIEGIPAILAGIPALMSEPFITSPFSGNNFSSLASLLKNKNYHSSFFHGGSNGTMGFDNFTHSAGFDLYFGRTEYNDDRDFDGSWGIYDEPFLKRFAQEINTFPQPFFATVFTISSHHPYSIPPALQAAFPEGSLPIHRSVRYTDYALQRFFSQVAGKDWYNNTLFVITSDHTALSERSYYQSRTGMYSIPLILYRPDGSLRKMSPHVSQQIDILPSVLDYLNYDMPFFTFGKSVFDSSQTGFAVNYLNDTYQYIEDEYTLILDTVQGNSLFRFTSDSLLTNNLVSSDTSTAFGMERKLKAIIQAYNDAMINNKMK